MFQAASGVTAVRRANQVYFEQVARRETLACGYAYFNLDHPQCPLCNFMGEVSLADAGKNAPDQVAEFFAARGARCSRWLPAESQPAAEVAALLEPLGFARLDSDCYQHTGGVGPAPSRPLKMIAARAMRRAYRRVIEERSQRFGELADALTEAHLARLDDPQYDAFLAMAEDELVGIIAVLQVGEIAQVCDLYVVAAHAKQGWESELAAQAAQTARRWSMRIICAEIAAGDGRRRSALQSAGFRESGTITSFVAAGVPDVWHA